MSFRWHPRWWRHAPSRETSCVRSERATALAGSDARLACNLPGPVHNQFGSGHSFGFQSFSLVPTLTAAENIARPAHLAGKKVDLYALGSQGITDTVVPLSNLLIFLVLSGLPGLLGRKLAGPSGGKAGRASSHYARAATLAWSPSHRTVQELADQVRMTVVPGILLDHVDIDPSQ
jgi:hypothetical protein